MEEDVMLTPESKKFFRITGLAIFLVIAYGAYTYFYAKNFFAVLHRECDPQTESCFVSVCDPKVDECAGDPVEDTEFFSLIEKKGYDFPKCDLNDEACRAHVVCQESDTVCNIVFCSEQTMRADARCSTADDIPLYLEIEAQVDSQETDEAEGEGNAADEATRDSAATEDTDTDSAEDTQADSAAENGIGQDSGVEDDIEVNDTKANSISAESILNKDETGEVINETNKNTTVIKKK